MRTILKAGRISGKRELFEWTRNAVGWPLRRFTLPRWTGGRESEPTVIFSVAGVLIGAFGLIRGLPLVVTFVEAGLIPRWSTTLLSAGLLFLGAACVAVGHLLDLVTEARQEVARLVRSASPPPDRD